MSYTTWVIAIFVLKFANFRYHGNRGQSEQFVTVTFKQADPQVYGLYLLSKASYSQFCVEICDFSLPWQQGRSEQIFAYIGLFVVPENPTLGPKITTLSYTNWSYNSLNFYHYGNRDFFGTFAKNRVKY